MHAAQFECHGHPVSASRKKKKKTKEQSDQTWGEGRKGIRWSLAECQAKANEGWTEHRAEHWEAELAFTEPFWEQGQMPATHYSGLIGVVCSNPASSLWWGCGSGGTEKAADHKSDACAAGDQVARPRVIISGLFHGLHSSGHANLKHICCSCFLYMAFSNSFHCFRDHPLLLSWPTFRSVLAILFFRSISSLTNVFFLTFLSVVPQLNRLHFVLPSISD